VYVLIYVIPFLFLFIKRVRVRAARHRFRRLSWNEGLLVLNLNLSLLNLETVSSGSTTSHPVPADYPRHQGSCIIEGVMPLQIIAFICAVLALCPQVMAGEYRDVTPDYRLSIPEDLYLRRDFKVQWWYLTGHLRDGSGREFGYELTFFVVGVQQKPYRSRFGVNRVHISHFAVTDVGQQRFLFSDSSDSGAFGFAGADEERLRVWVGGNSLEGNPKRFHIKAADGEKSLDLILTPTKPVVFHGDRGFSRKSEQSALRASLYFSYTNLATEGTLRIGDRDFTVTGRSWFDREISSQALASELEGWDWFALMLDDGREVMLYQLRKTDGSTDAFSSGAVIGPDGTYRHLRRDEFSVAVTAHYRSARTRARYPSRWIISVPSEALSVTVTPLVDDQEFLADRTTFTTYWEGACRITGSQTGRAYVEMTGYRR
jgi:predicted secreted hydrolase